MKSIVDYWKSALAANPYLSPSEVKRSGGISVGSSVVEAGELDSKLAQRFLKSNFVSGNAEVTLLIGTFTKKEFDKDRSKPMSFSAVVATCEIGEAGVLVPTSKQPLIQTDLLKGEDSTSSDRFFVAFHSAQLDYIKSNPWRGGSTRELLEYCGQLEQSLMSEFLEKNPIYKKSSDIFLFFSERTVNSRIDFVYKEIQAAIAKEKDIPLFATIASKDAGAQKIVLTENELMAARAGHMSPEFGLADSQRLALTNFMDSELGEVVALNGPPGTGKTTLLQSVVASVWVGAAIRGDAYPPKVIACSTNNQAVTNILASFSSVNENPDSRLQGRWIPEIESYGLYFKEGTESGFFDIDRMTEIESLESTRVNQFFLEKFRRAFKRDDPDLTLSDAVAALHASLKKGYGLLYGIEVKVNAYAVAANRIETIQKTFPQVKDIEQHCRDQIAILRERFDLLENAQKIWKETVQSRPQVHSDLSASFRDLVMTLGLSELSEMSLDPTGYLSAESAFEICKDICTKSSSDFSALLVKYRDAVEKFKDSQRDLAGVGEKLGIPDSGTIEIDKLDFVADSKIRQPLFKLATHYWEGRWIQEMNSTVWNGIPDKVFYGTPSTEKELEKIYSRRAMLTPCFVSTFHTLPKYFSFKNRFEHSIAFNFADVLIVDEAGQVTPEVGASGFAFAKRALVVGDTNQIEPVWSSSPSYDHYLALEAEVIGETNGSKDLDELKRSGHSVSSGSIMKLAQNASRRDSDLDLGRGIHLYEHRRGFDEIIQFCNELCYKGKLIPMRGPAPSEEAGGLPPMGFCNIPGKAEQTRSGSKINRLEAKIIVAWVKKVAPDLISRYKKPINEILAVVSPFKAQSDLIKDLLRSEMGSIEIELEACYQNAGLNGRNLKSDIGALISGTVHSLQGAERPIVLFSPVYSKHDLGSSLFFDESPSMLNVAVSRSKDAFLLFGDVPFLLTNTDKPSGKLASYISLRDGSEIEVSTEEMLREDFGASSQKQAPEFVNNLQGHREALRKSFELAKSEIMVVSPWVTKHALDSDSIISGIRSAVERGVRVRLFVGEEMNIENSGVESFTAVLTDLREAGAEVTLVNNMHQKVVYIDDETMIAGSFNWLSSSRSERFKLMEKSIIYNSEQVKNEKLVDLQVLQSLTSRNQTVNEVSLSHPEDSRSAPKPPKMAFA